MPVKTEREIFFAGRLFRVFDRDRNNCYFDSTVKNTNVPQKNFSAPFSFDRHNIRKMKLGPYMEHLTSEKFQVPRLPNGNLKLET